MSTNMDEFKAGQDVCKHAIEKMLREIGWKKERLKNFYKIKKLLIEIDELLDSRV